MDRVRNVMHANEVHRLGKSGKNITVAVLDTGICQHPDFRDGRDNRMLVFKDFVHGRKLCYDDASHGSHVCGILAGNGELSGGRYRGIAPGSRLISLKVLDQKGEGNLNQIMEGIDWVIQNRKKYEIRILNISAGTTEQVNETGTDRLIQAVDRAWDAGLVVVTAAGNSGPGKMTVTAPGSSKKAITVGSSDYLGNRYRNMAGDFSGCGPTKACICKPEVVAPGADIMSCAPLARGKMYYAVKSGTSMAAPVISGAIALLLEQENGLTNTQVKMRLKEASVDLGLPYHRQGWGMPDLRKLLKLSE